MTQDNELIRLMDGQSLIIRGLSDNPARRHLQLSNVGPVVEELERRFLANGTMCHTERLGRLTITATIRSYATIVYIEESEQL